MNDVIELTQEGVDKLKSELRNLIDVERPRVIESLTAARAQGDLSENADYDAARADQAEVEGRIKEIENMLNRAKVVAEKPKNSKIVSLGCNVTIEGPKGQQKYKIVGTVESNPFENKISNTCPLGVALVGKKEGDKVVVKVAKPYEVTVLKVEFEK